MGKRQYFRVEDFSGGMNPDRNALLIADNQAEIVRNFRLDKIGSLLSRKGYNDWYGTAAATNLITIGRWNDPTDPDNSDIVAQGDAGAIYHVNPGVGVNTVDTATAAAGEFNTLENYLVFCNGGGSPIAYDGDAAGSGFLAAQDLGLDAPVTAPTTGTTTGTLNGTYQYVYTYYHSYHGWESNPSASVTETPSTQGVTVTFANGNESDKVRIYRTTDGGSTYLRIAEVADTSSPYTDSGDPDGSVAVITDNDIPGNFEHMAYHKGYGFGSIGNTLYWSKPFGVHAWPVLNSTEVPFEGNDTITALHSFQDVLLIFGRRNTLVLAGAGGNWQITRDDVNLGALSDRTVVEAHGTRGNTLVVLTGEGMRVWPGYEPFAPQLSRELSQFAPSVLESANMVYVPEERSMYLTVNGKTYAVHIPNQAVSEYTVAPLQWLEGGDNGFDDPLFILANTKTVKQWGGADTDDGSNIDLLWRSKPYRFTNPESVKHLRRIGAYATQGATATVTVVISDSENTYTHALSSVSGPTNAVWGTAEWNTDSWASAGAIGYFIGALPAQTLLGRIVQLTLSSNVDTQLELAPPITVEFRETNRFLGA